jgi:hypothetical protein
VLGMRTTVTRRVFWALFVVWLGPSMLTPELFDHCPVHSLSVAGGATHAGHAGMMNRDKRAPNHSSHDGCTCLDQCCVANAAAPPIQGWRVTATVRSVEASSASLAAISLPTGPAEFLLPPTTGPPPRA